MKVINCLLLVGCFFIVSCSNVNRQSEEASLKEAYQQSFAIGTAMSEVQILNKEPGTLALVAKHFNAVTAENSMKWESIQPQEGVFNFSVTDAMMQYAEEHDISVIGHVLLWHEQTPAWVFEGPDGQLASKSLLLSRLKHHVDTVMGRYKGRIHGWDVVNEALNEDGSLRTSKWYQILGEDYIETIFQMAHEADPEAELYYNDYNLFKPEKRAGVLKLISKLKERNIPLHGIGEQGHYGFNYPDLQQLEDSIVAFADAGQAVMITELDISVLPFPDQKNMGADISLNLTLQQEFNPYANALPKNVDDELTANYARLFNIFLRHKESIKRVTFWGVSDKQTWRNDWPMKGRTDYPLLFDRENKPKGVVAELILLGESNQ